MLESRKEHSASSNEDSQSSNKSLESGNESLESNSGLESNRESESCRAWRTTSICLSQTPMILRIHARAFGAATTEVHVSREC